MKGKKILIAAIIVALLVAVVCVVLVMTKKDVTITVVHSDGTENVLSYTTREKLLADLLMEEGIVPADSIQGGVFTSVDGEIAEQKIGQASWELYANDELMTADVTQVELEDGESYKLMFVRAENIYETNLDFLLVKRIVTCEFIDNHIRVTEETNILGIESTATYEGAYVITENDDGTMEIIFTFERDGDEFQNQHCSYEYTLNNETYPFEEGEDYIKIGDYQLNLKN